MDRHSFSASSRRTSLYHRPNILSVRPEILVVADWCHGVKCEDQQTHRTWHFRVLSVDHNGSLAPQNASKCRIRGPWQITGYGDDWLLFCLVCISSWGRWTLVDKYILRAFALSSIVSFFQSGVDRSALQDLGLSRVLDLKESNMIILIWQQQLDSWTVFFWKKCWRKTHIASQNFPRFPRGNTSDVDSMEVKDDEPHSVPCKESDLGCEPAQKFWMDSL